MLSISLSVKCIIFSIVQKNEKNKNKTPDSSHIKLANCSCDIFTVLHMAELHKTLTVVLTVTLAQLCAMCAVCKPAGMLQLIKCDVFFLSPYDILQHIEQTSQIWHECMN